MIKRLSRLSPILVPIIALGIWLVVAPVDAVSTLHFLLDDADSLAAGDLVGTAANSDGSVTTSVQTSRIALPDVAIARCMVRAEGGTTFIGTGNKGTIYKLHGNEVTAFAETGELLVTSLARDNAGTLYAGTIPNGKIFAIDKQGKATVFAKPEGAEHIWSLVFDAKRESLFAATGPEGKVFIIDKKGRAEVYYTSSADHVMTLALDKSGVLYAGTTDEALLVRIRAPGRVEVVYDFPGNEVTDISLRDNVIVAAVNNFPKPPTAGKKEGKNKPKSGSGAGGSSSAGFQQSQPGKGQLWRVTVDGQAESLFKSDKSQLTKVQWANDDVVYAAAGQEGRIYRVKTDGSNAVWIDIDERQVLDMDLLGDAPLFLTGDTGAIYKIVPATADKATWTSKPLDAQVLSRFGELEWRGKGQIRFQTRSGNTEKPDPNWSDWSSPLTQPGPIRSPKARFLQLRALLGSSPETILYAVKAFYLPQNQRALVKDISVDPDAFKHPASREKSGADASGSSPSPVKSTSIYKISWKVDNPDADRLRFRLKYRAEYQSQWRDMLRETEILTDRRYDWDTSGVPDGVYRIRVSASDELDNPKSMSLEAASESEPVLVDNHPPHIEGLRVVGKKLQGKATDDVGPITRLEYAIDGREWLLFFPSDDIFDTADEPFSLSLDDLSPGSHIIAVRAVDAAGNSTSSEVTVP
jgi:sugar lactone lactonase YvrE